MAKYRKIPVVIEACEIVAPNDTTTREVPTWLVNAITSGAITTYDDGSVAIKTLEGTMTGDVGDMLIRGVKGELYACKPDIFALTYEAV